ncbi:CBS domain-containing protein [Parabacteroides sp. AD58]|uniref:CBS domain-containing protein n=1 Tax=Parabacteroides absconsus TaxID=2951805 RepID=A0ABZ2INA5_9BACT|nr:CBS domain-containing protein [Parabacteroides sp. AD58]MCM6901699.1 CBS domain-containing protein [Parabacteroides sp. AD58]
MLVKDFITKEIPVLKSFDTGDYALTLMDDYKLKHLPVVSDDSFYYKGIISEKELLSYSDLSVNIGNIYLAESPSVRLETHLLEVLALITRNKLSLLPVISDQDIYEGVVTRERLVDVCADFCQADAPGSTIILEVSPTDYSVTDIARIIESNNAHILSLQTHPEDTNGQLLITLKIDAEDASAVIRSFERFNYTVVWHFMENGMVDDIFQQRMNELIHYMNI